MVELWGGAGLSMSSELSRSWLYAPTTVYCSIMPELLGRRCDGSELSYIWTSRRPLGEERWSCHGKPKAPWTRWR
jgi:hypothetical protein